MVRTSLANEKGYVLPLALIALCMGALLVGSFLTYVTTGLISTRVYGKSTTDHYAAGAGVEDALWKLLYTDVSSTLESGDTLTYTLEQTINGIAPTVTIEQIGSWPDSVTVDDFESGDWSGGVGWLGDWQYQGSTDITRSQQPYSGRYHMSLSGPETQVIRAIDMTAKTGPRLQFWAKPFNFRSGDKAEFLVSPDGDTWTVVHTFEPGDHDQAYQFYDIDLFSFPATDEFWIGFRSDMAKRPGRIFIDNLTIISSLGVATDVYRILSSASGKTITASVAIDTGEVTVLSWVHD